MRKFEHEYSKNELKINSIFGNTKINYTSRTEDRNVNKSNRQIPISEFHSQQ